MKSPLLVAVAVTALAASGCGSSKDSSAPASSASGFVRLPPAAPAGQVVFYGNIKSLTRKGNRFELRLDPAWFLMGETAQRAAVQDNVIPPGEPVPNDNYVRDETHRLLTFRVPTSARATVLTNPGNRGIRSTVIPVAELAEIVRGRNPKGRALFVPGNHLGFWVRVRIDTVRSLDQQYRP